MSWYIPVPGKDVAVAWFPSCLAAMAYAEGRNGALLWEPGQEAASFVARESRRV
jgi:hypothetical protein